MNTSSLKSFAPAVRTQLMEAVGRKLDYVLTADTPDLRQAAGQVASLRREAGKNRAALIERVAYTWFNRLAALRFLDAQGWHPFKARVLTPATPEETQPELLKLLRTGSLPAELTPHTDLQRLNDLLDGRLPTAIAGADPQGEAYRGLILAACRLYHTLLPDVFDKLNDESELLLPDDLLTATSVAEGFRTEITDADCLETDAAGKSRANVEILGWLYQFYISEKKDAVMARKSAVPTEDIPAVTQLFTPHWIVRYLVENSLGRLWLLNRPNSRLREHMPYYIEGEPETDFLKITKPEEIRLVDPAVGSGHMLTYAFDLLTLIYEEEGHAPSEIPALILRHNLHGLDLCPRAAQLAELALVFKAREKSRRFFSPGNLVRPNITELRDVRFAENELRDYISALRLGNIFQHTTLKLLHQFKEAKNFGSLIQPCFEEPAILELRRIIEEKDLGDQLFLRETHLKVLRVLEQAQALTQRYHVVVANPPYMGSGGYSAVLKDFILDAYKKGKTDLYGCFLERCASLVTKSGYYGMITIPNWMFLQEFADLRNWLLAAQSLSSLIHLGRGVFGADFGSVAFVFKQSSTGPPASFRKLYTKFSLVSDNEKLAQVFHETTDIRLDPRILRVIPGAPLAYWLSAKVLDSFGSGTPLGKLAAPRQGIKTGNNDLFLRFWWEVSSEGSNFQADSIQNASTSSCRWFPCTKGGAFRKWYGNHTYVVNWENDGKEIRSYTGGSDRIRSRPQNTQYFFQQGVTWSKISISSLSARLFPRGFCFESIGSVCFSGKTGTDYTILGLLNSAVAAEILEAISPSVDFGEGAIGKVPVLTSGCEGSGQIANDAVAIARQDWDNFETSWDFRDQPLLRPGLKGVTLEASWRIWEAQSTAAIRRMQELETENNRLFIAAYGLDGELQPEVPEAQITLFCNPASRYKKKAKKKKTAEDDISDDSEGEDEVVSAFSTEERSKFFRADTIREFLSYAVGCMMGRYSPDLPGLILANAGDTLENFSAKIKESGMSMEDLSFTPDDDAIIPVLDGEWFEDDIVARTRDFLRATFGEATLKQNLRFIEDSLGKSLDKYFLTDFYKDHLQTYKKRPIYWLFQSPKKGFSALVYLHRYTRDTVNTLLNGYLRDYLRKLEARIAHLTEVEATASATKDRTAARKEREKLQKSLKDCQDWERNTILPFAQQRLEIDLDDGVKTNYLKFEGAVQTIPGLAAKED
jgi:hypothetical protein